jgi:toxin ParE1/3/4
MAVVEWKEQVEEDLIDIWTYVAQDDPQAADALLDEIDRKVHTLAASPYLGAARPDIAPELRHSLVGRYLILYRIITDGVQVVRVVHGARNLVDLF